MRKSARGFTLIEVVVAFVMLALVLAVGFEIFSTGLRRVGELEDYSRALSIAQSKLTAAGTEEQFKEGAFQGDSEDGRFHWTTGITRSEEGLPVPHPGKSVYVLFRVDVKVDWRGGDTRLRSVSLSTLGLGSGI